MVFIWKSYAALKHDMVKVKFHDESVRDLDPYSKLLTEDEKLRIIKEAKVNPEFFIQLVVKTKPAAKDDVPEFLNHISHSLSIASLNRQAAKKADNIPEYTFWSKMHQILTKACSEMHQPQYERLQHGSKK